CTGGATFMAAGRMAGDPLPGCVSPAIHRPWAVDTALRCGDQPGKGSHGPTTCLWSDRDAVHDGSAAGCLRCGGAQPPASAVATTSPQPALSPWHGLPGRDGVL